VELTYLLGSDGLTLNWKIKNNGTTTAPFACGMHPYFSLGGKAPGNVKLMIDANKHTIVDSSLNLTGDGMDEQNLFDTPKSLNTTYDDGYIKNYFNGNISSSFLYLDSTNLTHDFIKLSQSVPNGYKVA
jgi:galactose mutarotase-like enzyme